MKKKMFIVLFCISSFLFKSCTQKDVPEDNKVNNFIWKGLNAYYLWYDDMDDLQDSRFQTQKEINNFTSSKTPNNLFESLLFERGTTDKWSWIVSDYIALEQYFSGITQNNGMEFGVKLISSSSNQAFAFVKYIIPNSNASTQNINRGDIIYGINNTPLTEDNYRSLFLNNQTYTLNMGTLTINGGNAQVVSNGVDITLTKEILQENPVHKITINEVEGHKIGYLCYNQFTSNYDTQLNDAFLQLKNENITDLVLDLRYNSGGSVRTAIQLSSMITGQFSGELLVKEKWNSKWQSYFENEKPEAIINNFVNKLHTGETLNSLGLHKITVLISERTASSSELIINGLIPYIDVVLIGKKTTGKYVGSVTLYDSDNFRRTDDSLNPNHHYAMQPLVLEIVNKLDENDKDGFEPNRYLPEDYTNMGILGDVNEPLFAEAIQEILGFRRKNENTQLPITFKSVFDSKEISQYHNTMYVNLK
ncbi:MAG: S41 family peptidase [Flavobacteriaceae bacterium]